MSTEHCPGHDALVSLASAAATSTKAHGEQLSEIFNLLRLVKEMADKNEVRALHRDSELIKLQDCIESVDRKIENGLRGDIQNCLRQIGDIASSIERRRVERILQAKKGVRGFLKTGVFEFRRQFAFIFIAGCAGLIIWAVVCSISKLGLAGKGPMEILKYFGVV
jgi:hypothetical protein